MPRSGPVLGLTALEAKTVRGILGREPNETEWAIIDAEWSEHSSYKSSRALLREFPTTGERVVLGPGYDAGVVDVGDGYVVTLHIESHNHPSAVDPYGGAATGIGGVLRDIISVGSRPIALVDVLRFGDPERSAHSRWLFRNVVRGIADYGNCVGVPTVAGEVEFDPSFERNCLVDVACVGVGRRGEVILGEAKRPGDEVILIGGSTGRDGVGGASFASKNLGGGPESDRSSVQVPDPFMKKLLLDALMEVCATGLLRGMKDLGGGGLSTALSEVASKGGTGVDAELSRVRIREPDMTPREIMTSESQERMLLILPSAGSARVLKILDKYEVPHSTIGRVTGDGWMRLRWKGRLVAELPAKAVAEAPVIRWPASRPKPRPARKAPADKDLGKSLLKVLGSPNVCSRRWVYEQYDHEVGLRTVFKPGEADSSLLKLPNGAMLAVKADGNSRHTAQDPRRGGAGCVAEASRNVVAAGGDPVAMVDHLQFGDPSDPAVYWAFSEALRGMADYCRRLPVPVVGGKVSFYNEDAASGKAVKPSPVAMVVGLVPKGARTVRGAFRSKGETVLLLGETRDELGGSEYHHYALGTAAGRVPLADPVSDRRTNGAVLGLTRAGLTVAVHDCSHGGAAVALAEMCIPAGIGLEADIGGIQGGRLRPAAAMFSESHGRFLVSTRSPERASDALERAGVPCSVIGVTGGGALSFSARGRAVASLGLEEAAARWTGRIGGLMS